MIAEVYEGIVDTSVAGFGQSLDRYEVIDFTQGLYRPDTVFVIRRPSKHDFSLHYFWLGEALQNKLNNMYDT